jgi:hypothetical protein
VVEANPAAGELSPVEADHVAGEYCAVEADLGVVEYGMGEGCDVGGELSALEVDATA